MDTAQTNETDDADMLAGFNSDKASQSGDKTDSQAQPQGAASNPAGQQVKEPQPAADQSSGAEPQVDPFAALPEAVRNLLAEVPTLKTELATVTQMNRRLDGHVRSLQSQLDKSAAQTGAAATPPAPPVKSKLEQARESLGADMPEVMDALEELAALIPPKPEQQAAAPTPAPAVQAPAHQPDVDPVTAAHFEALDLAHPGWFETLESTDAKLWLASNPEMGAKFAKANTAKQLSEVLDGFKAHRQQTQTAQSTAQVRQTRMAAGVQPHGGARQPAKAPPGTEDDGMSIGFST